MCPGRQWSPCGNPTCNWVASVVCVPGLLRLQPWTRPAPRPGPAAATAAFVPFKGAAASAIQELGSPDLFASLQRFLASQPSPGGVHTEGKCLSPPDSSLNFALPAPGVNRDLPNLRAGQASGRHPASHQVWASVRPAAHGGGRHTPRFQKLLLQALVILSGNAVGGFPQV